MRWFEYKAELDALHASDDLKARLLALQSSVPSEADGKEQAPARADAFAAPPAASPAAPSAEVHRAPLRFPKLPWRLLAGLAACFALGMFSCDVLGWSLLPRMGSALSSTTGYYAAASDTVTAPSFAESGLESGFSAGAGMTADAAMPQAEALPQARTADTARKIIYTASLNLESKAYADTLAALNAALDEAGGYIEASDETIYPSQTRSLSLTLRVPANTYEAFMSSAAAAGNLTSRSENAEDITAQYVDVAARVSSLETKRDRLQALEQQAENLSDLLEIENSLSDVQYQLESWQSRLAVYDNQVDYCTVHVSLDEVQVYTPTQTSFLERVGRAFSEGLSAFGESLQSFVLVVIAAWPWLAVLALCVLVFALHRRRKAHRAAKNAARESQS